MNRLATIYINSWIELGVRWMLGVTFIYASYHKIIAPAEFAKIVYGYALFPSVTINIIAIVLPYLELLTGIALILGIYPRSAALIVCIMLWSFILILSINLARGHEFDCGCFSLGSQGEKISLEQVIVRDFIYLILALQVLLYDRTRKGCIVRTRPRKIFVSDV
ncbi:MAG: DoxX family membrane protein [Deltaproteobacteria bacterium]|nr:DoxX family membrane protein [Deltaproteobacteria bacterium]MBW2266344.1 DoxX family membrane protein [Deltaproteobacteria bacterium]MBW2601559.1 DoxX family membrane protein [Deltaproteobacteria bacterium]